MRRTDLRSAGKSIVAILCAACFLAMSLGSVSMAVADDTWETWPKKTAEPGVEPKPSTDATGAVEKAGDAAGKKTASGLSSGTIGWIAVGAAVVIGIAVAAGGGGGGGSSSAPSCNQ